MKSTIKVPQVEKQQLSTLEPMTQIQTSILTIPFCIFFFFEKLVSTINLPIWNA